MDSIDLIQVAFKQPIDEPSAEAGFERFCERAEHPVDAEEFYAAVAACLREGSIRDPVYLPEGALHCRWRLELTPKGLSAARNALRRDENSDA